MSFIDDALSVADDVRTGIVDGVMSWFDNESKQEEVRQAARQLELLANDLQKLESLVQSVVNSNKEVYRSVVVQKDQVRDLIGWDPSSPVVDGMKIAMRFSWFASAAAGTVGGGAVVAAGVARACTALGNIWTAAMAPAAQAASAGVQIEMQLLSEAAQAAEVAQVVESASFATRAMRFAKVAGKLALAAFAVAAILQTVVGGIVRAQLREQANKLKDALDSVRKMFPEARQELKKTTDALQAHYFRLAPVDPVSTKHYVDHNGTRVFVDDFLADINRLYDVAQRQGSKDSTEFDDLVGKISIANAALRIELVDAVTKSTVGVALNADAVAKAIELLRSGVPMAVVQGVYQKELADAALRNSIQAFVAKYPSNGVKPQLKMDGQGLLTVEAA